MTHQMRDLGINRIVPRGSQVCYGMGIGIMLLDDVYPGFPGDVRNASAYPYPIQYEVVEGVDIASLVWADDKSACREPIVRAARRLERMGCRAIAAECGYFSTFQQDVVRHVSVPVFMSSLLQVPWIQQVIAPDRMVGILCAQRRFLTDAHLLSAGIDPSSNIAIGGALDEYHCREFDKLWDPEKRPARPEACYDEAENGLVRSATDFVGANPGVSALLLECTGFQPFARAIQRVLDMPVFSWGTLLDYAYSVTVHRDFYGHV